MAINDWNKAYRSDPSPAMGKPPAVGTDAWKLKQWEKLAHELALALEYHQEQTRPIARTKETLNKARWFANSALHLPEHVLRQVVEPIDFNTLEPTFTLEKLNAQDKF